MTSKKHFTLDQPGHPTTIGNIIWGNQQT